MIDIDLAREAGISDANIMKYLELYHAEQKAKKRELNRIYQQNHRSRKQLSPDRPDTPDSVNALSLVSKNIKETKKERGGFVCPLDFKPDDGDYHIGEEYGHSRVQVDERSVGMMEWSHANRNRAVARKSNWHLTLRGMLRRNGKHSVEPVRGLTPEEYHRKYTGNGNGQGTKTTASDGDGIESADNESELFPARGALHSGRAPKR